MRGMGRFSLKQLLAATTLLAIGIGAYCALRSPLFEPHSILSQLLFSLATASIGAGIGALFDRPVVWATIWFIAAFVLGLMLYSIVYTSITAAESRAPAPTSAAHARQQR